MSVLRRLGVGTVFACSLVVSAFAQESVVDASRRVDVDDLRSRGRTAVRELIAQRRDRNPAVEAAERKEFDACLELASEVCAEGGGDIVPVVLGEAEGRLIAAQARARERAKAVRGSADESARLTANLAAAYHHMAGDIAAARRLYRQALREDPSDEVALAGMARLERDEEVDTQKEIENERLREIQAEMDKQPRSRPSEKRP